MKTYEEFKEIYNRITNIDEPVTYALHRGKPHGHEGKKEYYPYIPLHGAKELYEVFCKVVEAQTDTNKYIDGRVLESLEFWDIGAGTGRIVQLAKEFGIKNTRGLEYCQEYVHAGRELYGFSSEELMCMDGFDVDHKFMQNVGIVYTYMPIAKSELMTKLHCHLVSLAAWGTAFVEMLPSYYPMSQYRRITKGFGYIWIEIN